jgi:hypothetical protein
VIVIGDPCTVSAQGFGRGRGVPSQLLIARNDGAKRPLGECFPPITEQQRTIILVSCADEEYVVSRRLVISYFVIPKDLDPSNKAKSQKQKATRSGDRSCPVCCDLARPHAGPLVNKGREGSTHMRKCAIASPVNAFCRRNLSEGSVQADKRRCTSDCSSLFESTRYLAPEVRHLYILSPDETGSARSRVAESACYLVTAL